MEPSGDFLQFCHQQKVAISNDCISGCNVFRFKPEAAKATTLFLHGTGNDAFFGATRLFQELLNNQFNVITLDLPGHGRSSHSHADFANFRAQVRDLGNVLDHSSFAKPWHLIGHSLGCLVALEIDRATSGIATLTLLAPPLHLGITPRSFAGELNFALSKSFWSHLWRFGHRLTIPAFKEFRRHQFPIRSNSGDYILDVQKLIKNYPWDGMLNSTQKPLYLYFGDKDFISSYRPIPMPPLSRVFRLANETHLTLTMSPVLARQVSSALNKTHIAYRV